MTFVLSSAQAKDVVVVQVRGELDMGTAQALWSHVSGWIERGQRRILIDCTDLTFLDCFGLSALLRCSRAASLHGGSVQLCRISIAVLRLLSITGVARLLVNDDEIRQLMAREEEARPTPDAPR